MFAQICEAQATRRTTCPFLFTKVCGSQHSTGEFGSQEYPHDVALSDDEMTLYAPRFAHVVDFVTKLQLPSASCKHVAS